MAVVHMTKTIGGDTEPLCRFIRWPRLTTDQGSVTCLACLKKLGVPIDRRSTVDKLEEEVAVRDAMLRDVLAFASSIGGPTAWGDYFDDCEFQQIAEGLQAGALTAVD